MDLSLKYYLKGLYLREDYGGMFIKIVYFNVSVGGVYFVLKDYDIVLEYFDNVFVIC